MRGQAWHGRVRNFRRRRTVRVAGTDRSNGALVAVEASALHAPSLTRLPLGAPLLRLRSDEQLLALFRAGSDEAFGAIHDRYRQRLFAYVRQMLSAGPRQDAEDVMQDVFVRAYGALRADEREVNLRAWLYRVAHNRCIDHLRRPTPPPAEIFEMSRKPLHDPIEEAQRREDLARLVEDVGRLPEQQRSALLMREIDGMSYADLAVGAGRHGAGGQVAARARARRPRRGRRGARRRLLRDPRRPDGLLRPRREGVRPRAPAHALVRRAAASTAQALRGMRRSFAALTPVVGRPVRLDRRQPRHRRRRRRRGRRGRGRRRRRRRPRRAARSPPRRPARSPRSSAPRR